LADQATVEVKIACYVHNDDEADFHINEPETTALVITALVWRRIPNELRNSHDRGLHTVCDFSAAGESAP
jgi:hypothetical protein